MKIRMPRIRKDIFLLYRDIHTWVGIVSALTLFVTFYAGAITMFKEPLTQWGRPPSDISAPPSLALTDQLLQHIFAQHPEASDEFLVHLGDAADIPARVTWPIKGGTGRFGASLDAQGKLEITKFSPPAVTTFIDELHQKVGLPMSRTVTDPLMGAVALLYSLALVSGVIILLPSLVKNLFALRIGSNLKRMWLDIHNALGLFSLPFHVVMALTSVIFAFHDQIYDMQGVLFWKGGRNEMFSPRIAERRPNNIQPLSIPELVRQVEREMPGVRLQELEFERDNTSTRSLTVFAIGRDPRYLTSGAYADFIEVNPYTGKLVRPVDAPEKRKGWEAVTSSFFSLHFGSYGGLPVRWGYFILGLVGAFIFYSGNLLWIESRRKSQRQGSELPVQRRDCYLLAAGTIGVCLGCICGISLTIAAGKWLHGHVSDLLHAHEIIYYATFFLSIAWAFLRGAAKACVDLLWLTAISTFAIPATTLLAWLIPTMGLWAHADAVALSVDITAFIGGTCFVLMARATARSRRRSPVNSVWFTSKLES